MLEVLPLSPVREWAISRSFIASTSHELDLWPCEFARQQDRRHRDHIACRFENATAGGGAIGVERFDLVADPHGLAQVFGAAGDAHAHPLRLVGAGGKVGPVQRMEAIQVGPHFTWLKARE